MSLSFLSPPDKGSAESPLPGLFRSPFLRGSGDDPEWERSGDGGGQGMEALSLGMFPREACPSSCAGHGAIMKGWSRSREERMDEEFFFLILFLDLCKLHPGRREWLNPPSIFPGMASLFRDIPNTVSPLEVLEGAGRLGFSGSFGRTPLFRDESGREGRHYCSRGGKR